MKRLAYIFIPILAILLMSHNTFALENEYNPVVCYNAAGTVTCQNTTFWTADNVSVLAISRSNNNSLSLANGDYFVWSFYVRSSATMTISLANGFPEKYNLLAIDQYCNSDGTMNVCNVLVAGMIRDWDFNIQLAGFISTAGVSYSIETAYFNTQQDWAGNYYLRMINNNETNLNLKFNDLLSILRSNPNPSAQDISDAINGDQQSAGQTQSQAGDTAASNSEQAVEGATQSLFSAMGTVVSALRDTPASDCLITVSSVGSSQVFTSAIGQLNVCSVPSGILAIVQGLAALVIVPMVLMACYSLLHKIYNAFKEVQDT